MRLFFVGTIMLLCQINNLNAQLNWNAANDKNNDKNNDTDIWYSTNTWHPAHTRQLKKNVDNFINDSAIPFNNALDNLANKSDPNNSVNTMQLKMT